MTDTNTRAAGVRALRDAAASGPWKVQRRTVGWYLDGTGDGMYASFVNPMSLQLTDVPNVRGRDFIDPTLAAELADALDELARVRLFMATHVARLTGFVGGAAEVLSHGDIMARKVSDGLKAEVARFDAAESKLRSKT